MSFQIKDFVSVSASLINWCRSVTTKITDFNIGSVVRTMLEACAAEIDELYQQIFLGLKEAIPVSVYNSFDFAAKGALAATGLVRVSIMASLDPVIIAAGTSFTIAGSQVVYTSSEDSTITPGDTFVDLLVVADVLGIGGNIDAGKAFVVNPQPEGFVGATNLSAFMSGVDGETEDERKVRFNAFIASLPRGTLAALDFGLKKTELYDSLGNVVERVVSASIVEPYLLDPLQPIALVKCYVHNGVGATSSSLVSRASEIMHGYYEPDGTAVPGWKAAGVVVEVYAAEEVLVPVTAVITTLPGFDHPSIVELAEEIIFTYLQKLPIGASCIRAEIVQLIMETPGVFNIIISAPSADVDADLDQKLMPGALAIT